MDEGYRFCEAIEKAGIDENDIDAVMEFAEQFEFCSVLGLNFFQNFKMN